MNGSTRSVPGASLAFLTTLERLPRQQKSAPAIRAAAHTPPMTAPTIAPRSERFAAALGVLVGAGPAVEELLGGAYC